MCKQVGIKKEWILIFEKQLDRINRIVRIERPSAEGPLVASEKNLYPVKSYLSEMFTP
jgi:hypothetical protein